MSKNKNSETKNSNKNSDKNSKKKISDNKYGKDFVPPDGGWGWLVAVAGGFSNLCGLTIFQQFGVLFPDRLKEINISNSEITAIINIHSACIYASGLVNGPVFRKFTFRQVGLFGAVVVVIGLLMTAVADSFMTLVVSFGILYGFGLGLVISANALALNTYFKEKRRNAIGISWTVAGLGPIVNPYIIASLLDIYGTTGAAVLYSGLALHSIACSLIFQPVEWHCKKPNQDIENIEAKPILCAHCQAKHERQTPQSFFSSQFALNADGNVARGYEICGTPMLAKANDGWFSTTRKRSITGSKLSIVISPPRTPKHDSRITSRMSSNKNSFINLVALERQEKLKEKRLNVPKIDENATEPSPTIKTPTEITEKKSLLSEKLKEQNNIENNSQTKPFSGEHELLTDVSKKLEAYAEDKQIQDDQCECEQLNKITEEEDEDYEEEKKYTFWEKIFLFFDLDLLSDIRFLNQIIGITASNFAEINFTVLTPFVLMDFGFTIPEIAQFLAVLAILDILIRFFIPFLAGKIGWDNRSFFLFGVVGMATGRVVLAHFHSYNALMFAACWIGVNKGLKTIFMNLIIPSYVPLHKLPGATGLYLIFAGLFYLTMGPLVGMIRDATDYAITLHCLNMLTYMTAISWGIEKYCFGSKTKNI